MNSNVSSSMLKFFPDGKGADVSHSFSRPAIRPKSPLILANSATAFRSTTDLIGVFKPRASR